MSPACAERQPWLVEMLNDMAKGVINMISAKVRAYRESTEADIPKQVNTTGQFQENFQRVNIFRKLQKEYLVKAVDDSDWTPMGKVDAMYLPREKGVLRVKIPQK